MTKSGYQWIDPLRFYAKQGDAVMVSNIYFGLFEFDESIPLLHLLKEGDLFLDIGANSGHYSLVVSGLRKVRSIAIEPVPGTFQRLRDNIELNQLSAFVQALNLGVSDQEGALFFSTDRGAMNRIFDKDFPNAACIKVATIDGVLNGQTPLAMKIDVEGYEQFAFNGAGQLLSNAGLKVLVAELNGSGIKYGVSDEAIYNTIQGYGFQPYIYDFRNRKLILQNNYNTSQFNTVFVRDIDFVSQRLANSPAITVLGKTF
jgi:FkbM family methyltransferase